MDSNIPGPSTSGVGQSCSKPLHMKRLERALDMSILANEFSKNLPSLSPTSDDYSDDVCGYDDDNILTWDEFLKEGGEDTGESPLISSNFMDIERSWLANIIQEEPSPGSSSDFNNFVDNNLMEINTMLKFHKRHKKVIKNASPELLEQNMYYGSGLISNFDKYPENKKALVNKGTGTIVGGLMLGKKKRDEDISIKGMGTGNSNSTVTSRNFINEIFPEIQEEGIDLELDNNLVDVQSMMMLDDEIPSKMESIPSTSSSALSKSSVSTNHHRKKVKKFKDEESKRKWEEMMHVKRKKAFSNMIKKEVGKQQRAKVNRHKEALLQNKKIALACQKVQRLKALQSARAVKELQWRMKRLSRENLAYWKRSKRVDRENRRKLEKEAEEQRKIDFELVEAKRQQRKLNFLITQTELYAHFMSRKLGEASSPEEQLRILSQLDEDSKKDARLGSNNSMDDYDSETMKAKAIKNAQDAFQNERARTRQFDMEAAEAAAACTLSKDSGNESNTTISSIDDVGEFTQPAIFMGTLKAYQLRGMNWLANLYDQGISGILADEMGLGKTVQSIAFLSHLAEVQNLWGPFLVICPASTLHNWQQEFAKFVPNFKVVPYWGNPADRKILRQFWNQDGMHTRDAGFHVVITSYQIVISDVKYFNRIKWQYMVLDEAQAIKSTSSMRWKTLLGFNCRNRLLLSGTPIQNSMAELWALLHFIMPTLFDSHEEFNEWFSKDIESHAENKTGIDEKHLSRLHMILKPFMLRRIKKDVENELSDKIEIMVYCPLTTRQKLLYMALKQKIHIEDLLHYTVGGGSADSHSVDKNFTSNLMNLVMQFRKVCNHPELFERRDAKSPIYFQPLTYNFPYFIYDQCNLLKQNLFLMNKHFVFSKEYIAHAVDTIQSSIFQLLLLSLKLSSHEIYEIFQGNILVRWKSYFDTNKLLYNNYHRHFWSDNVFKIDLLISVFFKLSLYSVVTSNVLPDLLFTWGNTARRTVYTYTDHYYHSMPETVEHRNIRCRNNIGADNENGKSGDESVDEKKAIATVINEFVYKHRQSQVVKCTKTEIPSFIYSSTPKVTTLSPNLYCYSRRAAYDYIKHVDDWSWTSLNNKWAITTGNKFYTKRNNKDLHPPEFSSPIETITLSNGWSNITIPDKETLVTDSGKLFVLDSLLKKLKEEGHRVLIYSQMTKMIDLLEEYMWHRHHKYMRLDGSSKISERRDMVADFQARTDIFVFLLSTRAGGLGINLTAADTVIFYDSDWNPTVDQQAMDRAHRLGQTKQVTVYRLICKGSIEERILQRAREKSEIQNLVISGGNFKPETLKPKEVVSLLLDDEEIELKYRQRTEERKHIEDLKEMDRKRKYAAAFKNAQTPPNAADAKKVKQETSSQESGFDEQWLSVDSVVSSPHSETSVPSAPSAPAAATAAAVATSTATATAAATADVAPSDDLTDGGILDIDNWDTNNRSYNVYHHPTAALKARNPSRSSSKRGRPRGSRRISALGRFNSNAANQANNQTNNSTTTAGEGAPATLVEPTSSSSSSSSSCSSTSNSVPTTSSLPFPPFENPVTTTSSTTTTTNPVRRGPGRPRLKPGGGPTNAGTRGTYRPRKPAKPLPVPLPSDGNVTSSSSSYTYFNLPQQNDS